MLLGLHAADPTEIRVRELRKPTLDENNRWFTAAVIGGGGVIGSVASFLVSSALVLGIWRLWQGYIAVPRDRSVRWIGAAFASFFLAEALSTMINYSGPWAIVEGIVSNLPFLAFLIVFGRLSLTPRDDVLRWVEIGAIGGGIGAFVVAMVQVFVLGAPRAEGMAGNPGPFALVCSVLYCLSLVTVMQRRDLTGRLAALAAAASALAVLLSGMRSLWPVLVLAPILIAFVLGRFPKKARAGKVGLGLAAAMLLVTTFGYRTIESRVVDLADDYEQVAAGEYDNSLGQRLRIWRAAVTLIGESPVFGHGPGKARVEMAERTTEDGGPAITYSHAHNFVLNAWMRSGFVGVAAMLSMFIVPLWMAGRTEKDAIGRTGYAMMSAICLCYVTTGLFNNSFGHDILDALFIYSMITASYLVFGASATPRRQHEVGPVGTLSRASTSAPASAS
jgi:O-antigen ligase